MNWNAANTSCDKAREAIADALMSPRDATRDPDVERHIATCAECRAYRAEVESMWAKLGELPVPTPRPLVIPSAPPVIPSAPPVIPSAARDLGRGGFVPIPAPPLRIGRLVALAAGFVIAALLGYGVGVRGTSPQTSPAVAVADTTPQFLILLYDTRQSRAVITPAKLPGIITEYGAWGRSLAEKGNLVRAEKLSDAPADWLGGSVNMNDDARVGGFFLIRARDLNEARRIAEGCPHLKYGGRVELRPIEPT